MSNNLAPFVPSPPEVVRKMLKMANVGRDDIVYDLGCGDGRILIMAVKDFGAKKAVGFEKDESLYKQAITEVKKQGLENKISILNSDVFSNNISEATVITLYLTTNGNDKLRPKLASETYKGTRIISHDFDIPGWNATKMEKLNSHTLYLYIIPKILTISNIIKKPSLFRRLFSRKKVTI